MPQQVSCNATERIVTFIATSETDLQNYKTFGEWVKKHREEAGLSQEGAAEKSGLSRYQWMRIENAQSGTKRSTVEKIAKSLSGNVDEALSLAGFSSVNQISDSESVDQMLSELPEETRDLATKQVKAIIKTFVEVKNNIVEPKKITGD